MISGFSAILAVLIWTLAATLILAVIRFSNLSALYKYHIAAAGLMALPVGLLSALFLDFSGLIPALIPAQTLSWVPVYGLPEIVISSAGSAAPTAESGMTISLFNVIITLFVVLIVGGWMRLGFIYYRLKSGMKNTRPVNNETLNREMNELKSYFGIKRPVRVLSSSDTSVPFTTGVFRPVIVLPEHADWTDEGLRLVLSHETVHISRADYVVHLIEIFIRHTFWMHPLVHVLYHKSACWREVACDQTVMRVSRSDAKSYARMLYEFALSGSETPAFKAAMAEEHHLLRRIREIEQQTKSNLKEFSMKKSITFACAVLLLTGGAMSCSDLSKNPGSDTETTVQDGEITLHGQTITADRLREIVTDLSNNLDEGIKAVEQDENPNRQALESMKEHKRMLDNFKMLMDNGQFTRVARGLEDIIPAAPPRPELPIRGEDTGADVFTVVEQMPEMIGGQRALYEVLRYPELARRAGIEGRVILQFIVDEEGNVVNPQVVRSGGGGGLDEAALDAIRNMKFKPGVQRGRNVQVQMTQPVVFRLSTDSE